MVALGAPQKIMRIFDCNTYRTIRTKYRYVAPKVSATIVSCSTDHCDGKYRGVVR